MIRGIDPYKTHSLSAPPHPPPTHLRLTRIVWPWKTFLSWQNFSLDFPSSVNGSFWSLGIKLPTSFTHLPHLSPLFLYLVIDSSRQFCFHLFLYLLCSHCHYLITLVDSQFFLNWPPSLSHSFYKVTIQCHQIKLYQAELGADHLFIKTYIEVETALPVIQSKQSSDEPSSYTHPSYSSPTRLLPPPSFSQDLLLLILIIVFLVYFFLLIFCYLHLTCYFRPLTSKASL